MATKEKKSIGNPNGANQWIADPRQQLFLAFYKDPKSPTFSNARQSALKAGFSEEYSDNILGLLPDWLSEAIGTSPLLAKAERNLEEALELPSKTQAMGMYGPIFEKVKEKVKDKNGKLKTVVKKVPMLVYNRGLLNIKTDVSKFVAETVGKQKYSKKDSGEGPVYNNVFIFGNDQRSKIAKRIIGGGSVSDSGSERTSD